MDSCSGTITVEYYDGSSDFSESDETRCPSSAHEQSPSPSSTSSAQNTRDSISCKSYDFKHGDSDNDHPDRGELFGEKIFSAATRETMSNHYFITHQEYLQSLVHPKASIARCPRGDVPEQYGRRKHPGPFLTCSFAHCHECGDDFVKVPIPTKPSPEYDTFTRPQHLKERKAKFFKQCKHCETIAFTHHRNPARHYEDYLNNVTYKRHSDHTKVWQQHVVDLMFTLGEDSFNDPSCAEETVIVEKCKHYKPSEAIVNTTRYYPRNTQRKMSTVVSKRRASIARPLLRRPLNKTNVPKVSNLTTNLTRGRPNLPEQTLQITEENQRKHSQDKDRQSLPHRLDSTARNAKTRRKSKELHYLHPKRRSSSSGGDSININGRNPTALHQRLKASITRLINSRQASSKVSKRFEIKKPEPPKEVKYIQRGKPNISAKFLRARSRSKILHSATTTATTTRNSNLISSTTIRSKGGISLINSKKLRPTHAKSGRGFGKSHTKHKTSNLKDADSSDDGSYAKYRDQNGEFDVEKYRQSIVKMLSRNKGVGAPAKKKKQKRSSQLDQTNFVSLPTVKNAYRNVKPRITSNFTQRKRRKVRNAKRDSEFDLQIYSDISLKSKYWNTDSIDSKDSYFSIPSINDL